MTFDIRAQLQNTLGTAYTLERELGGGGMSRVFVADEARLKRKVVVKVLSPELAQGINADRFEREIQLAASLQQANIVPVLNAGETGGLPYYTMPFVEGQSLRSKLHARAALPIGEAVLILRDVARALAYAHERGIVHRDIKPDNVLLSGGAAVVTDFGIAKAISASRTDAGAAPTLTQLGTSIGTPAYISPEQAAGDPDVDYRADIYSFGCMGYELLTGRPPFMSSTPQRLIAAHISERPQPIVELRPDVPMPLAAMIMRCLEKEASARPQSAAELFPALDATQTSDSGYGVMPSILLGGPGMLKRALAVYVAAFIAVAILAKAAIVGIGLPDWVFPGALIVMALGLPVILFTAYTQYIARRAMTTSPSVTPGGSPAPPSHGTMATIAMKASPHLSWRRTALGGVYAVSAFVLAIGLFMLLRAFGIGPAGSIFASGRLNARDLLIVSDFRVKGADSSLGSVVSEAVRTGLAESEVISILNPTAVAAALARMQRPRTTLVDLPLARDIALREGAKAVVDGDITPLGAGFVLSLRLVTADSGLELAAFHETASGPNELLPRLDKLVRALRGRMGESLKRVHADPPLEQVTTASLEALRKFADARRANNVESDFPKSAALLEQAVALDTTFAMAYRSLGIAYGNLSLPREKSDSAFAKAYRYRDRLSERERYLTTANYYQVVRDRAREMAAYDEFLAHYPHDYAIPTNLGLRYETRREWTKAESLYRRSIVENSASTLALSHLVRNLITQGRIDEAAKLAADAQRQFPGNLAFTNIDFFVEYGRQRYDSAAAILRATLAQAPNPINRSRSTHALSILTIMKGRLSAGMQLRRELFALDSARGATDSPLPPLLDSAFVDAWFREQPARAAQTLDAALSRYPLRTLSLDARNDYDIAGLYALASRPDRARAIIAQFDADVRDTIIRRDLEPYRHRALAEIAIAERRPRDAVTEIRAGDRATDGPQDGCAACTYASLGRAFDLAGMPDSAIANLELFVSTRYAFRLFGDPFRGRWTDGDAKHLAGAYKRLGELYEAKGDRQKAASYYAKFVDLWKNSDPELQPKVAEVKKRLARLSDTEKR